MGLEPGRWRSFCVAQLLTILDDRNFDSPAFIQVLESNITGTYGPVAVGIINRDYATFDAYNAVFPQQGYANTYYTDGPLDAQSFATGWVDPLERDRRLDIIDVVLGDNTSRV